MHSNRDAKTAPDLQGIGGGKMEIQISSGQGPEECEFAVGKLLAVLKEEFRDIEVLDCVRGKKHGCFRSVRIESQTDLSFLEGTVKWICQSPFRPQHKRKNWFVDISLCAELDIIEFDEALVRFETFRCGGKGGQHVNKVETGVRAVHIPTGAATVSTEARSQHQNRKIALNRLCELLAEQNLQSTEAAKSLNRLEHTRIERGNPGRVYKGMDFVLVQS